MFGFKPPDTQPSSTQGNNAQQGAPSIFQQSSMQKNTTILSSTTNMPSFGLFQQGHGSSSCAATTEKQFGFQFGASTKPLLPTPSQSELSNEAKSNLFKSPPIGFFSSKTGNSNVTEEQSKKNFFGLPSSQTVSQNNPFTKALPSFSFTNSASGFSTTGASKPLSLGLSNIADKAPTSKIGEGNSSTPAVFSKASIRTENIFVSEMQKQSSEESKPAFSFVKAKDNSDQPNQSLQEESITAVKPVKMDEDVEGSSKRKPGIKSRLSMPVKPPPLKIETNVPTKGKFLKSPTVEDISKITSIVCKDIPDKFNNKKFITSHFSKFGTVKSTRWNNKKKHVTVTFVDHAGAKTAKIEGSYLGPDEPKLIIFWAAISPRKKNESDSLSEVDKELQAMGGGDFFEPKVLARPETSGKETGKKSCIKKKSEGATVDESLLACLERTATNYGDCLEILDARDKLMRTKRQKQSDIGKAIAIAGTCPDMCPEKERYSRSEKNGLSLFELYQSDTANLSSSTMNPKAVVKEYSRSSADQEEPLSHELRPPHVLDMTMNYLLCNIMDVNCSAGEWFDFIWNRSRAIRKDITQQHLCNELCVALVEKCARFHIYCSAAFSHEDISVFDPKINNENLTKCLQTLKHFYHDLSEKNIFCPNEAEFMAYDILLNLNEGDTIRQAQQLRKDVRESNDVRFAIEVFFAQNSNNYVRFFRLVKKSSYLNACILQRYFPQVRRKAFSAMCRAYRNEQISPLDLIHLLCFEDEEEVKQYCEWLQLQIDASTGVQLRKFVSPSTAAPAVTRSSSLINGKRMASVGVVVNGGSLPENPYLTYEPHDSFDSNGKLRKNAYDAQDQADKGIPHSTQIETKPKLFTPVLPDRTTSEVVPLGSLVKPSLVIPDRLINDAISEVCAEALLPLTFEIADL